MKRCYYVVITASLVVLLTLRFVFLKTQFEKSFFETPDFNKTALKSAHSRVSSAIQHPANTSAIAAEVVASGLFLPRNLSTEELQSLRTWYLLNRLINNTGVLPNAVVAIREAEISWNVLIANVEKEKHVLENESSLHTRIEEKQCPYFLNQNTTVLENGGYKLFFPCGLIQSSSITVIGIPSGLLGNFQIDLMGEKLPDEPDPPIIFHFNVRLHGDKLSDDPIVVQNTWTVTHGWGLEERCPSLTPDSDNNKVDEMDRCNKKVGKENNLTGSWKFLMPRPGSIPQKYFPFREGYLFVITFNMGIEGIQATVDGKHITSFAYRESLEPWLVSEVRISGDLNLISAMASSLPTSEDVNHTINFETLKTVPLLKKELDLFIGVFSTANNFRRRMAVRRTWMQYADVRSGAIAVRFFVGLHKNSVVNEKLWNEAQTYGDIQLMPFVDYYGLITWKTLAICIFGTKVIPAKYIMKTDDDAFVRVDMILSSLKNVNVTSGLLFGLVVTISGPHRSTSSKWYISPKEWPEEKYPPWAHGPGYVISQDIAKKVHKKYTRGRLKMFKLEDVAMGIWIAEMETAGLHVKYENDNRIHTEGCKDGYIVSHYQNPSDMLCLWANLLRGDGPKCCSTP